MKCSFCGRPESHWTHQMTHPVSRVQPETHHFNGIIPFEEPTRTPVLRITPRGRFFLDLLIIGFVLLIGITAGGAFQQFVDSVVK